jgi:hypothetical protein
MTWLFTAPAGASFVANSPFLRRFVESDELTGCQNQRFIEVGGMPAQNASTSRQQFAFTPKSNFLSPMDSAMLAAFLPSSELSTV